jgi:hypothetical protein
MGKERDTEGEGKTKKDREGEKERKNALKGKYLLIYHKQNIESKTLIKSMMHDMSQPCKKFFIHNSHQTCHG